MSNFQSNKIEYKGYKMHQDFDGRCYLTIPEGLPGLGDDFKAFPSVDAAIKFVDNHEEKTQCPDITE